MNRELHLLTLVRTLINILRAKKKKAFNILSDFINIKAYIYGVQLPNGIQDKEEL